MAKWQVLLAWESWVCVATTKAECEEGELDASVARKHTELREVHGSAQGREWWQESRPCGWVGGCVGTSST